MTYPIGTLCCVPPSHSSLQKGVRLVQKTAFSLTLLLAFTTASLAQVGGKIAFESNRTGTASIFVMDDDGGNLVQVTDGSQRCYSPTLSPSGDRIAYVSSPGIDSKAREIYVMNIDGSNQINLTNTEGRDDNPVWSPDGSQIAFWSIRDGNPEIYVMNADGSNQTNITNTPDFKEQWPTWWSDGSKVLFSSIPRDNEGAYQLFSANVDGSERAALSSQSSSRVHEAVASVSPDGSQIAFETWSPLQKYDLWVMDADGNNRVNLTRTGGEDEAVPVWSPDGSQIAYLGTDGGAPDIWIMNADGSNPINLTQNGEFVDSWPSWSISADLVTLIKTLSWGQVKAANH